MTKVHPAAGAFEIKMPVLKKDYIPKALATSPSVEGNSIEHKYGSKQSFSAIGMKRPSASNKDVGNVMSHRS